MDPTAHIPPTERTSPDLYNPGKFHEIEDKYHLLVEALYDLYPTENLSRQTSNALITITENNVASHFKLPTIA